MTQGDTLEISVHWVWEAPERFGVSTQMKLNVKTRQVRSYSVLPWEMIMDWSRLVWWSQSWIHMEANDWGRSWPVAITVPFQKIAYI